MIIIKESWLNAIGLTKDEFGIIWIILLIVGAFLAGLGISSSRKKKDWLKDAQKRQNARYEYSDPVSLKTKKKWDPNGWYYDEDKKKWVSPDYIDSSKNTSWEWNERARMWVDPAQMDSRRGERGYEAVREKWDELKREEETKEALKPHVHLTSEEKELAKQIRISRTEPTFEEWKAAREKEQGKGGN